MGVMVVCFECDLFLNFLNHSEIKLSDGCIVTL